MGDDIRIGVFICNCGGQVKNILSIGRIEKEIKKLDKVEYIKASEYPCSKMGLKAIQSAIKKNDVNRIVVAGCSPRLIEQVFARTIAEAGLNPNFFEMTNIRDHCAKVHKHEKRLATTKAIELIKGTVKKVAQKKAQIKLTQNVNPSVAVIGGGIAGMSAALSLASRGTQVKLIEKESKLGGLLNRINLLYPRDIQASEFLNEKVHQIQKNANIEVMTDVEVQHVEGAVGNYCLVINNNSAKKEKITAGAIIYAGGVQYLYPNEHYHYESSDKIITQLEFEKIVDQNRLTTEELVFIQCVGSRNEERPYCARFCCPTTFKNVIYLKKKYPELKISVIFRGLTEYIKEYDEAMDLGVLFVRYDPKEPPEIMDDYVYVRDEKTEKKFEIPYDLLILATPLIPRENAEQLGRNLRLPVDEYGFIIEPHIKLRPNHFAPEGIFVAGSAHWPGMIGDSIAQGYSAAARAYSIIEKEIIERESVIAAIDPKVCRGCGKCIEECPFQAIKMIEEGNGFQHAEINEFICKGCGMCSVVCICGAASVKHLSDKQLDAMVGGVIGG